MQFRKVALILSILAVFLVNSCAKSRGVVYREKSRKVGEDPVADIYLQFIRSDIEKYSDDPAPSLESIDAAIASDPSVGYFYYQRAILNTGTGEWEEVVKDLRVALSKDPQNVEAKVLLGRALGVLNKHQEAIKYLEEARKSAPGNEDIYIVLAKEYLNVEKYKQAEMVMLDLLARNSEALVAYYYLGAIYGAYLKQPTRAIVMYERLLEREPENVQVIEAASQLYLELGKSDKSLAMLLELEKHRPSDVALKIKIAGIYYKLKNYPQAIDRFEDVLEKNPQSDKIAYYLGVLYEEEKRYDDAMTMYERVPPDSGLYKDARIRLAFRYKTLGDENKAKSVLLEAARRNPKIMEFYQYLAGIYEREGDLEGATKILEKATKHHPDDEKLFFAIATLYDKTGNVKMALVKMREVVKINPDNASALNYIGYTLLEEGQNLDEAEDILQRANGLKPNDGYILDSLGWLYFKRGDHTRAFSLLQRAVKLAPGEPTVLKHMGEIYLQRGDSKEALKYFKQALELWKKKERADKKEVDEIVSLIQRALAGN